MKKALENRPSKIIGLCALLLQGVLTSTTSVYAQCNPDMTPPVINCPTDVTVQAGFGECEKLVNPGSATVTDNCPGSPSTTNNAPASNIFPLGKTQVTFTATDGASNTATCRMQVEVKKFYSLACNAEVTIPADPSGITEVFPDDIEEGGGYCFPRQISLQGGQPAPSVGVAGTGTFVVVLWMQTHEGQWVQCWGELIITAPTGSNELSAAANKKVLVSPQPAADEVFFKLPYTAESATIQLYNTQGKMVKQTVSSGNLLQLTDISDFSGLYFYTIQTSENDLFSGKIMMIQAH